MKQQKRVTTTIYTIEHENGESYETDDLREFCADNDLVVNYLRQCETQGTLYKGFRIVDKKKIKPRPMGKYDDTPPKEKKEPRVPLKMKPKQTKNEYLKTLKASWYVKIQASQKAAEMEAEIESHVNAGLYHGEGYDDDDF